MEARWIASGDFHTLANYVFRSIEVQHIRSGWYARIKPDPDPVEGDFKVQVVSGPWEDKDTAILSVLDGLRYLGIPDSPNV